MKPGNHIIDGWFFRVMKSVDSVLHLSNTFDLPASEPGIFIVEFIFSMAFQLVEASLDDEGLMNMNHTQERDSKWASGAHQEMQIDGRGSYGENWGEFNGVLKNANTLMAIEMVGELLQNKITSRILFLARRHMYVLIPVPSH